MIRLSFGTNTIPYGLKKTGSSCISASEDLKYFPSGLNSTIPPTVLIPPFV